MNLKKATSKTVAALVSSIIISAPFFNTAHASEVSIEIKGIQSAIETMTSEELLENANVTKFEIVDEFGTNHSISMDYNTMEMTIDGEKIDFQEEEIPLSRATINASSAARITGKIPWKGSVILLAAAIGVVVPGVGSAALASWAATIAGALTADAENIYVTFYQYKSKEKYWSSYNGTWYNKYINKNIFFKKSSISGKVLKGPVHGSWFDPVRPH